MRNRECRAAGSLCILKEERLDEAQEPHLAEIWSANRFVFYTTVVTTNGILIAMGIQI
jgi:hypothetical protein